MQVVMILMAMVMGHFTAQVEPFDDMESCTKAMVVLKEKTPNVTTVCAQLKNIDENGKLVDKDA